MPSKKKKKSSRGKARKGSNSKKKEGQEQHGTLDKQMERLNIDDDTEVALLDEAIKLAAAEKEALESAIAEKEKIAKSKNQSCCHGCVPTEEDVRVALTFGETFVTALHSVEKQVDIWRLFAIAREATEVKYPEVWKNPAKLKMLVSFHLYMATQSVLEGEMIVAKTYTAIAFHLEECLARATLSGAKLVELHRGDDHTLVQYLRKKIPCQCLDAKYEQVKSITKIGFCCNDQCSLPNGRAERRSMVYCTRCRDANYCSRECQVAAWQFHKKQCHAIVDMKEKLDSRK
eukprot:scaffold24269_cov142-Skeletonema_dohrnii-CCMP3373.AAC.6